MDDRQLTMNRMLLAFSVKVLRLFRTMNLAWRRFLSGGFHAFWDLIKSATSWLQYGEMWYRSKFKYFPWTFANPWWGLGLSLNWARKNETIHAVETPLFGRFLWRKGHSLIFVRCKRHCINWLTSKDQNINEKNYVNLPRQLIKVIKSKSPGKLMKWVMTHKPRIKILSYSVLITALHVIDIPSNSFRKIADDTSACVLQIHEKGSF